MSALRRGFPAQENFGALQTEPRKISSTVQQQSLALPHLLHLSASEVAACAQPVVLIR